LYAPTFAAFSENHKRIIEAVARQIGRTLRGAAEFDSVATSDAITGLPSNRQLERLLKSDVNKGEENRNTVVLFIDVFRLKQINTAYGRFTGDEALRFVVTQCRSCLRV